MTVANPWMRLPRSAPFLLDEDAALVAAFNAHARAEHRIDTTLLPEPFLGRAGAPVVLLGLNPGWSPDDAATHSDARFIECLRTNLEQRDSEFPFHLLNPSLEGPGSRWWRSRLGRLIDDVGLDVVASSVLCVEYFPYHSHSYGSRVPRVPSQEFSFELVRAAIERDAVIVVMRSARRWGAAVPKLQGYARRFDLRSVQNVSVSPRNCPDGYSTIVEAIRAS